MLDVAIIGGGLCGLALAHSLQARGADWRLFEARDRLGGRILSQPDGRGGRIDLGPTWFWPDTQPSITRLIEDLGLPSRAQADDGRVLLLDDPQQPARVLTVTPDWETSEAAAEAAQPGRLHGGARRLDGGMAALVDALVARIEAAGGAARLRTGQALEALVRLDDGSGVELQFAHGAIRHALRARHVVLALPPRLALEQLRFEPALETATVEAMQATPTWMATAAKAALVAARPFWQDRGLSGNAWVTHAQAVLAEVFDAGTATGAALAGFQALAAEQRRPFARAMPLLLRSQFVQLFGPEAEDGLLLQQDWAEEPRTCSQRDLAEDGRAGAPAHPAADARLLQPAWNGRLWLGGAETAQHGTGYLEGALSSAARLRRELQARLAPVAAGPAPARDGRGFVAPPAPLPQAAREAANDGHNDRALQDFARWVAETRAGALQRYRQRVHHALAAQQRDQLTQRAVLSALESIYAEALARLDGLPLVITPPQAPLPGGRAALTPRVLAPFGGLADELLGEAVRFNRGSCALSNFPQEHQPPRDYLGTIRRDLAAAWQAFALEVDARLIARTGGPVPA